MQSRSSASSHATAIAEYLAQDPLASFGIAPFLDVESAAHRIFRLIEDADLRLQVGHASAKLAESRFGLDRHVAELDKIAQECALKKQQEKADRLVISRSNLFDTGFFTGPVHPGSSRDPIRHYISAYSSGIRPRKPFPAFTRESTENATILTDVIPWRITWIMGSPRDNGALRSFATPGKPRVSNNRLGPDFIYISTTMRWLERSSIIFGA